jgi:hypothetical protein
VPRHGCVGERTEVIDFEQRSKPTQSAEPGGFFIAAK